MAEQVSSHAVERGRTPHRIESAAAMHVNVDEARCDEWKILVACSHARLDRGDPAVFDDKPARLDQVVEDESPLDLEATGHALPFSAGPSGASTTNCTSRAYLSAG